MFHTLKKEITWNGKKLQLKTGKLARQADASVVVTLGETVVLCTVVGNKNSRSDLDFLGLTVNYQEKFYAAGKIPGGFLKRETKPGDAEVLTSRLIDRPIRPLFPKNYHKEIQVVCTVLSYDNENPSDIPSLIGASAALWLSGLPIVEPIAAIRVGHDGNEFIANFNTQDEQNIKSNLDLVVAATQDSIFMVESSAKETSEEILLQALEFAQKEIKPVINLILELAKEKGIANELPRTKDYLLNDTLNNNVKNTEKQTAESETKESSESSLDKAMHDMASQEIIQCFKEQNKQKRYRALTILKDQCIEQLLQNSLESLKSNSISKNENSYTDVTFKEEQNNKLRKELNLAFETCKSKVLRQMVLSNNIRIDGRKPQDIRKIQCDLDLLPRTHGSALFTRGETQALVALTLGIGSDEQMRDSIFGTSFENFMLHYNFPPFSVGEASALRAPGRREIGHGNLAHKALKHVVPSKEKFPYTIRLVSDILESNGSSSMATVCGSSLALMAAGVPIQKHVAGIAMGLIKEGEEFVILSDILGDEDHLGDMDFKVAATKEGITALQMDIKIRGINLKIIKEAISQARNGVNHILDIMQKSIETTRKEKSQYAPSVGIIEINTDKIREIIGPSGKTIREICEKFSSKIDVSDEGKVTIFASDEENMQQALKMIRNITTDPQVGDLHQGKVTRIENFGAFVKIIGNKEGLVHISEITNEERVNNVRDYLQEEQEIRVQIIGVDPRTGKIQLSMNLEPTAQKNKKQHNRGSDNFRNEQNETNRSSKNKYSHNHDRRRFGNDQKNDNNSNNGNTRRESVRQGQEYGGSSGHYGNHDNSSDSQSQGSKRHKSHFRNRNHNNDYQENRITNKDARDGRNENSHNNKKKRFF